MINWQKELFLIYPHGKTWSTDYSTGFRLYTKKQLVYVVAGGTSIHVRVNNNHFRKVIKKNKQFLQISEFWYKKNKSTFEQCLTYDDFLEQERNRFKTNAIDVYLQKERKDK